MQCDSDYGDDGTEGLCRACEKELRFIEGEARCPKCSLPSRAKILCRACRFRPPVARSIFVLGWYDGALESIIKSAKFAGDRSATPRLLRRILPRVRTVEYDAVVAVPSDHGFAESLADEIAGRIRAPLRSILLRNSDAPRQGGLSRRLRRSNAPNTLNRRDVAAPQTILLVDDVVTTGATLDAAASRLLEAGAQIVDAVAVARVPIQKRR